ncbi:uncharacterized protein LOC144103900 isoform X2 [Amblyomma americanum]
MPHDRTRRNTFSRYPSLQLSPDFQTGIPWRQCAVSSCRLDPVFTLLIVDIYDWHGQMYCTGWWTSIRSHRGG